MEERPIYFRYFAVVYFLTLVCMAVFIYFLETQFQVEMVDGFAAVMAAWAAAMLYGTHHAKKHNEIIDPNILWKFSGKFAAIATGIAALSAAVVLVVLEMGEATGAMGKLFQIILIGSFIGFFINWVVIRFSLNSGAKSELKRMEKLAAKK